MYRLRLSSHPLKIETGRYGNRRTERHLRLCSLCNKNDIEDEYHFIIICPLYTDLRKKIIKRFYHIRPSVSKFVDLMNSNNKSECMSLSKFVLRALCLRNTYINSESTDSIIT
jgi:hypothetical protein